MRLGYSPGCSETDAGLDSPQHSEQLSCVLEVFGQALLQRDLNIFRVGLAAIENLNNKWKLYHKVCKLRFILRQFSALLFFKSTTEKLIQLIFLIVYLLDVILSHFLGFI